jgi:hypothetical protein
MNLTRPKHTLGRERPHRSAKSRPGPCGLRGVTPASCCWESQHVFWPQETSLSDRLHPAVHAARRQVRMLKGGRSLPVLKAPPKKPKTASLQNSH